MVLKSFADETERAFAFLADELGLAGPVRENRVIPVVVYGGPDLRYCIQLEPHDMQVTTSIQHDLPGVRLLVDIDDLVRAAGLRPHGRVSHDVRTMYAMRKSLDSQARFVRLLHPLLTPDRTPDLLRRAGARELQLRAPGPSPET